MMNFIKKIKFFFQKKKKIEIDYEFNSDKENNSNEPCQKDSILNIEPLSKDRDSGGELKLKKVIEKKPSKNVLNKKKKTVLKKNQNKDKIRNISSKEDLYELFTGEKNPGISEYIPPQKNHIPIIDKNCRKEGKLKFGKVVDLHGLSSFEAAQRIENSIVSARQKGFGSIQFITGKGKHSKNMKPVLRSLAEKKAVELKKDGKICSFEWEKKHKKKSGSIIIYL